MAKPREHLPGVPVHITARGVGGRDVFLSDDDRQRFLADLLALRKALPFVIHAFCLMSNHIHLLLEAVDHELSKVMQALLGKHAERINRRLGRVGHLFQRRFDDVPCFTDDHYRNAVSYINNNPVRAGMVKSAKEWAWSSERELLGLADNLFVDRGSVLKAFGGLENYEAARDRQTREQVVSISNTLADGAEDPGYFRELSGTDLDEYLSELVQEAATSTGLSVADIVGPSIQRREATARKAFIASAKRAGVPAKVIARFLNRSTAAISQNR